MSDIVKAHIWSVSARFFDPDYAAQQQAEKPFYRAPHDNFAMSSEDFAYREFDPAKAESDAVAFAVRNVDEKPGRILKLWTLQYRGEDVWWSGWFSHVTFSRFDSEDDAFRHFQAWLEDLGIELAYSSYDHDWTRTRNEEIGRKLGRCFMAAEDRWRWRICDCDGCKKRGITAIVH